MTKQILLAEAQAWRDLTPDHYDHAVEGLLDQIGSQRQPGAQVEALIALTSATLRREEPDLTESRAACIQHLLVVVPAVGEAAVQLRISLLVLLAWLRLGAVVERGPEFISTTPELPFGVVLPQGADPADIADPVLRDQARAAAERHGEQAQRWNSKQRALGHLHTLAELVRAAGRDFPDDAAVKELFAAMSLAPGLPVTLREVLSRDAQ